jgi:competence protein ComEA
MLKFFRAALLTVSLAVASMLPTSTVMAQESAQPATKRININTADQALLETLPGIGPSKAKATIEDRTANGKFNAPQELVRVRGIGPKTMEKLLPLICTDC